MKLLKYLDMALGMDYITQLNKLFKAICKKVEPKFYWYVDILSLV